MTCSATMGSNNEEQKWGETMEQKVEVYNFVLNVGVSETTG